MTPFRSEKNSNWEGAYLLLAMFWALAYILAARLNSAAFAFAAGPDSGHLMKGFTAIYYSFITLCTVGYGDIVPVSGAARMLAVMEGIAGTFYMAILVARLVSLHSSAGSAAGFKPPGGER